MNKSDVKTVVSFPFPLLEFEDGMPSIIRAGGRQGSISDALLRGQATQLLTLKVRRNHDENISALCQQVSTLRGDGKRVLDMLTTETEAVVNEAIKKLEAEKASIGKKRKRA